MTKKMTNFLLIVIVLINVGLLVIFVRSQSRAYQAEQEMVDLVNYDYSVKRVNQFYWTTIDETYFAMDFIDQDNKERYAIVTQEGGAMSYYDFDDLITESEAKTIARNDLDPIKILRARLGLQDNEPVWEVTIKNKNQTLTYYYINAKTGEWIEKIENI